MSEALKYSHGETALVQYRYASAPSLATPSVCIALEDGHQCPAPHRLDFDGGTVALCYNRTTTRDSSEAAFPAVHGDQELASGKTFYFLIGFFLLNSPEGSSFTQRTHLVPFIFEYIRQRNLH